MKTIVDNKKKFLIAIIIVVLAASLFVLVSTNIFLKKGKSPEYHQTALATFFAPTKYSPFVELTSAQANSNKLSIMAQSQAGLKIHSLLLTNIVWILKNFKVYILNWILLLVHAVRIFKKPI
jgi:hypothetical protein